MSNSTTFSDITPRDLIAAIGGAFKPGDRIKSFLCIVGKRAGVHPRVVKAAWIGGPVSSRTLKSLQEAAAANATRSHALELAAQLETMAIGIREVGAARAHACGDVLDETASQLRRAAGLLREVA